MHRIDSINFGFNLRAALLANNPAAWAMLRRGGDVAPAAGPWLYARVNTLIGGTHV